MPTIYVCVLEWSYRSIASHASQYNCVLPLPPLNKFVHVFNYVLICVCVLFLRREERRGEGKREEDRKYNDLYYLFLWPCALWSIISPIVRHSLQANALHIAMALESHIRPKVSLSTFSHSIWNSKCARKNMQADSYTIISSYPYCNGDESGLL